MRKTCGRLAVLPEAEAHRAAAYRHDRSLADLGIALRHPDRLGEQRAACPQCAKGPRDDALAIRVDSYGATWYCHRCGWRGATRRIREHLMPRQRVDPRLHIATARAAHGAERERQHTQAAARAARLWAQARQADPGHSYLTRKGIKPHGARQLGERLVLPITTPGGSLVGLQFIAPDGTKRFLRGARKRGCCIVVNDPPAPSRLLICEGWATGASLAEADRTAKVIAGIDAGNLIPVALGARDRWPDFPIVLAGDNDASGTGQRAAHAAARAVGGLVLIPDRVGADWNDWLSGTA